MPRQPQALVRKLARIVLPSGVCVTSGWNCSAVERHATVLDRGVRAGVGRGERDEIVRNPVDLVAVAHPDLRVSGDAGEQVGRFWLRGVDSQLRAAKLAGRVALRRGRRAPGT